MRFIHNCRWPARKSGHNYIVDNYVEIYNKNRLHQEEQWLKIELEDKMEELERYERDATDCIWGQIKSLQ